MIAPMLWGVSVPFNLLLTAAIGVWLMFAPTLFGTAGLAANTDHLVGAVIAALSVIVMAEVIRAGRFINLALGVWLIAAPWLVGGGATAAGWNDMIAGLAIIALSIPRGPVRERYSTWDRVIV